MKQWGLLVLAVGVALAVVAAPAATARQGSTAATTIAVAGKEFSYTLSKKSAPRGTVVFRFTNKGKLKHDFKIGGKKTPIIGASKSATLRVILSKAGRYPYLCTVAGHAAAGMKGVFTVR